MTIKEFFDSKDNRAIHCNTEKKAKKLLKAFDKVGYQWTSGYTYTEYTNWNICKKETCYTNDGYFTSIKYLRERNYTILEFDEIKFEGVSLKSCEEKIQSVTDKEEKEPQNMKGIMTGSIKIGE